MAYTSAHGPPDLDAKHLWTPATGSTVTLNDVGTSWIKVDSIQGWRSLPEADDNREAKTVGHGEVVYESRYLGKTLVYEGRVMARDREAMRAKLHALVTALGASKDEGVMTVTPFTVPGGVVWTYSARVIDLTPNQTFVQRSAAYSLQWGFTFSLRMSDPHFYTGATAYL